MNRTAKRFYEFDAFRIDVAERQLLREEKPVLLTPKVFDVLLALVENYGHTLEKDALIERVWANTFVEDGNLNRNISTLRKILGDDSHKPRFIKTLPKRGYRFDADVREILEEDEEVTVERRTNYRVAIKEVTETRKRWVAETIVLSPRFLMFSSPLVALLILGFVWAAQRPPTSEINPLSAAEIRQNRGTQNTEAFELYQTGRALWQNRSVDGLHQATVNLERAILLDPGFALAHAALADAYAFDVGLWKKAEATANEAIRLDPTLGQPHATIGFVRTFWEWKFREAEPYFKQAIALSPDYATGHQWYALNLAMTAQGGSSLAEMKRALELDPTSLAINADLCQILYFARKFDQAIEQCRKTLEMDANFLNAHAYLYDVYTAKGMYAEAVNEYLTVEELNMTTSAYPAQLEKLKKAFATGGIRAFWRARIEMLNTPKSPAAYGIARYYTRLGERDEAIHWFRRAYQDRDFGFIFLIPDPAHAELATDPRAHELAALLKNEIKE
jgi:DNA-binding winged helix-turn-helix (wHTH) protein/Tfp pilus assembly protein PilF